MSFKDALCGEKANEAITNAFKELWEKEQVATDEDNKRGVAMCFSYLRRVLAIDAHSRLSSLGEHVQNKIAHNKFILSIRVSIYHNSCTIIRTKTFVHTTLG